mmetsp:Transcript_22914/g.45916  ORF Transcript_22914/g.45916 Transcript_22914/m.45916 type:complete len:382 (+) Transcript_22914:86-1231(+)
MHEMDWTMSRLCSLLIILAVTSSHNISFIVAKGESTSTCEPSEIYVGDENMSSTWEFMNAFSKLGTSWNHVIGEYIGVVQGADGKEMKGDSYATEVDEALKMLHIMVKDSAATSDEDWSFSTTPLNDFGKTIDDILLAFIRWSMVDNYHDNPEDGNSCTLIGGINHPPSETEKINVSKAFRRLTAYQHWMQSVSPDLQDPPLTFQSIKSTLSIFSLHVSHDECERLVWFVNLGKTDLANLKSQSPRETTRMFVWIAHLLFLDEKAQTKGLIVVDDMADIGFWDYMTMLPIQVGISVDRFLISVTPLKAKNVVLMHRPKWAEIGYSLLSWFLTKKMKNRVTMVEKGQENDMMMKVVGGAKFIPIDFSDVEGLISKDIIAQHY